MSERRPSGSGDEGRRDESAARPRPSTRRRRPGRRRRRGASPALIALLLIVVLGAAGWWYWNSGEDAPEDPGFGRFDPAEEATGRAGDRAIVLVFPEWDASGYVTEQRQIPSRDRQDEDLQRLMGLLCDGPDISGAVSALPSGTRALGAFLSPDDQSVVLDFSRELVTGHPGGSAAESATLTSILRTVALNYPATRSCVILVEGAQVETLGGHIDLVRPFDPRRWL